MRDPRRRDRHRADQDRPPPPGPRGGGARLGPDRSARRSRRGRPGASQLHRRRLRRGLHEHLGPADGAARRRDAAVGVLRARALDGHRPPGRSPGARRRGRRRSRRRGGGRLQPQRRRRHPGRARDDPPARPGLRGGAAGPDPARDALARAQLHLRHRGGAAGHRPAGVAELPPLPARGVRRLRRALGRSRGRLLRARRAALRGDGRGRARAQLHPAGSRRRDALVAARLHRHAARRVPQPRLPVGGRLAPGARGGRPGVRRAGDQLARRGRPDHRRLLRGPARAPGRRADGAHRHQARPRAP